MEAWWWIGLGLLAAVPLGFLVWARGRAWLYFLAGAGAWYVAILAKLHVNPLIQQWLLPAAVSTAVALGFFSGISELGLAAPFLRLNKARIADAVAVGLGAGLIELLDATKQGWGQVSDAYGGDARITMLPAAFGSAFLIERSLTSAGHVSSRLLVFAAIRRRSVLVATLAVTMFAAVDGTASYCAIAGIDLTEGSRYGFYFGGVALVTAIEFGLSYLLLKPGAGA